MEKLTDRIRRAGKRAKSNLSRTAAAGDNTDAASSGTATPPIPATADGLDAAVDHNVRDQAADEVDTPKPGSAVQTKVPAPAAVAVLDQQQGATAAAAAAPTDAPVAATLSSLADAAPSRHQGFEASLPTDAVAAPTAAPELLPADKPLAAMLQPLADDADISMTQDVEPADDSAFIAADSALIGLGEPAAELPDMGDAAADDDANADAGGMHVTADDVGGDGTGVDGAEAATDELLAPQSAAAVPVAAEPVAAVPEAAVPVAAKPVAAEPVAAAASANGVAAGFAAVAGGAESQPVEIEADGDVFVPAAAAADGLPSARAGTVGEEVASGRGGVRGFVLGMVQYAVQSIMWTVSFIPDRLKSAVLAWLVVTTLVLPMAFMAANATFAAALCGLAFNFTVFPLLALAWPPAANWVLEAFYTGVRVAKQQAAQLGL